MKKPTIIVNDICSGICIALKKKNNFSTFVKITSDFKEFHDSLINYDIRQLNHKMYSRLERILDDPETTAHRARCASVAVEQMFNWLD